MKVGTPILWKSMKKGNVNVPYFYEITSIGNNSVVLALVIVHALAVVVELNQRIFLVFGRHLNVNTSRKQRQQQDGRTLRPNHLKSVVHNAKPVLYKQRKVN